MFHIFADGKLIYQPGSENLKLISPKLTVEMGKAGSLEFSIPPTNKYFDSLQQLRTSLTVTQDEEELFRGRVLSNKRNFTNVRDIYGEGNLSFLVDSCQKAKKYDGSSHALFNKIIEEHNRMIQNPEKQFTVGTITTEDRNVVLVGQSDSIENLETNKFDYKQIALNSVANEWQNTFEYIESCLTDYCGGYLRTRYDATTGVTYIDWLKDYYDEATQTIQLGKNLLDLTEEVNAEELFTVLIPLGDENLTIEKVNNGSIELVDEDAVSKYGRIIKTNVFDGVTKPATLLENAKRYLENNVEVTNTVTVTAVDLHLLNPTIKAIHVGDKVRIVSPANNVDRNDLVCTKIEYDLANPANTVYTFGNPKQSLTERYRKNKKNDASRGGGGGGKAAEEVKKDNDEIWSAWIKSDPDHAIIDIGALYKKLYPNGDDKIVSKAQILMGSDSNGSSIDLVSSFNSKLNAVSNEAGFKTRAGPNGPQAIMYVTDHDSGKTAELNLGLDYTEITDDNGDKHYEIESVSNLIADKVIIDSKLVSITGRLEAVEGCFESLEAGTLRVTKGFSAPSMKVDTDGGLWFGNNGFSKHYHSMESDPVTGKITLGDVTWSASDATFSIADTKFYKDKVSALTIKSLDISLDTGAKQTVSVKVKNAAGSVLKSDDVNNTKWPDNITYTISNSGHKKYYTITPKLWSFKNKVKMPSGNDYPTKDTGTECYDSGYSDGKNSVTVSCSITSQGSSYAIVKATASNGASDQVIVRF